MISLITATVDAMIEIAPNYTILDACVTPSYLCILTDSHLCLVHLSSYNQDLVKIMNSLKVFNLDGVSIALTIDRGIVLLDLNTRSTFEIKDALQHS